LLLRKYLNQIIKFIVKADFVDDLEQALQKLSLNEMNEQHSNINNSLIFDGKKNDLESFITRIELAFESRPNEFQTDEAMIRYDMSFMIGRSLE